jgi:hypothetical protein
MFTANEIYDRVKQRPFTPIRIKTSGVESYDIHHPDLVLVGRRFLELGTASSEDPRYFDQISRISILHITAIEDLPVSRSVSGNGEQ